MLEWCRQFTKEAMIYIDNQHGLTKFTSFNQIKHDFRTFLQKRAM